MQFLLTNDERNALVPKKELNEALAANEVLRKMVPGVSERCCHDGSFTDGDRWWHCDRCPIPDAEEKHGLRNKLCRHPKDWGK